MAPISLEVVGNPDIEPGTYRSSPWEPNTNGNGNGGIYRNGRKAQRLVLGPVINLLSLFNDPQTVLCHCGR